MREVELLELPWLIEFILHIRREVFPMFNPEQLPQDIAPFARLYHASPDAAFLAAFDGEGQIAATAAFVWYDDRLEDMKGLYAGQRTAELVRCYVHPACRKLGLGTSMVNHLLPLARAKGYEAMYLHTRRFLPGAVQFWEKQGFIVQAEPFGSLEIVHMDKKLV
ncbi:GNAT family N-acetyltransferase [Paenibacillus sp. y28]|uniref:GNAT family N-acetyltransferase n=1 Tax=Paenibacillus sp. y28 TaxID=3129110 RepID=UPI0030198D82